MQLRLPVRLILVKLVIFLSLALAVSAAQAGTYTETFSGPLNPNIWEVFSSGEGVTINVTGGELVITIPAHATGSYNCRYPHQVQYRHRLPESGGLQPGHLAPMV